MMYITLLVTAILLYLIFVIKKQLDASNARIINVLNEALNNLYDIKKYFKLYIDPATIRESNKVRQEWIQRQIDNDKDIDEILDEYKITFFKRDEKELQEVRAIAESKREFKISHQAFMAQKSAKEQYLSLMKEEDEKWENKYGELPDSNGGWADDNIIERKLKYIQNVVENISDDVLRLRANIALPVMTIPAICVPITRRHAWIDIERNVEDELRETRDFNKIYERAFRDKWFMHYSKFGITSQTVEHYIKWRLEESKLSKDENEEASPGPLPKTQP